MSKICSKSECTGCGACNNICPKNAIEMVENELGELYPMINNSKCINCGLCKKICPSLELPSTNTPKKVIGAYSKDFEQRKSSTSGGLAATLYEHFLKLNGVVYGVSSYITDGSFKFVRINNINELHKLKGSKYVHCYLFDIFKEIKSDLLNGKKVLFIGTPCQVSGLKKYLKKEYSNLFLIDIICHGVSTQKLLFDDLKINNILVEDNLCFSFRDITGNYYKITKGKHEIYRKPMLENLYFKNFLRGNIFRENCYSCKYTNLNRVSDITIGDFWGIEKTSKIYDDPKKGISLVLLNTTKGLKLFDEISSLLIYEEKKIEDALPGNPQLVKPVNKYKNYVKFVKKYRKKGYLKAIKQFDTLKDFLKTTKIYKLYKKFK